MLHRSRFLIGGLVVVLTSAAVSYAVSAAVPSALRPSGSTRYAMAQSTTQAYDNDVDAGFEDMTGMATSISIPTGKKGDVMVVFCGENSANTPGYVEVRAMAGGTVLSPSGVFMDTGTSQSNYCASFYRLNVPAGTRTVKMQ